MDGPFASDAPKYVHLPQAPIVRTLVQVRFPAFAAFASDDDRVAKQLAMALSEEYPRFSAGHEMALMLSPDGVTQQQSAVKLWRYTSADTRWQVSLGPTFLSVETSNYHRRSHFVTRLMDAWNALSEVALPPVIERVGVRYVNQVTATGHLDRLSELLRPEVLGVAAISRAGASVRSALAETHFVIDGGEEFQARWGLLPAGFTPDPLIPATDGPNWILDMDASQTWLPMGCLAADFDLERIATSLAGRGYQFYRWAVTDEWLRAFGGDI